MLVTALMFTFAVRTEEAPTEMAPKAESAKKIEKSKKKLRRERKLKAKSEKKAESKKASSKKETKKEHKAKKRAVKSAIKRNEKLVAQLKTVGTIIELKKLQADAQYLTSVLDTELDKAIKVDKTAIYNAVIRLGNKPGKQLTNSVAHFDAVTPVVAKALEKSSSFTPKQQASLKRLDSLLKSRKTRAGQVIAPKKVKKAESTKAKKSKSKKSKHSKAKSEKKSRSSKKAVPVTSEAVPQD